MNLLEYEAKQLLKASGIPVPASHIITRRTAEISAPVVLKSQVPTGGRGKLGGVRIIEDTSLLSETINELFDLSIKGHAPKTLLAEEKLSIQHEYYLSMSINRSTAEIEIIAHTNGGIEVEENTADTFLKLTATAKYSLVIGERLTEYYDIPGQTFVLQDIIQRLYACFKQNDATLIEINPLILTTNNALVAGDAKITLDDAAEFRHPDWNFEQKQSNRQFIVLDERGLIATIANGAGLAMATVDAVATTGLRPINFLDIGGGATAETIVKAFRSLTTFPNIRGVIINIFAGITRCDEVAKAIIDAIDQIEQLPPLFIRLAGNNYSEAKQLLNSRGITLLPTLQTCLDAAKNEVDRG